jgi:hypothetical protein
MTKASGMHKSCNLNWNMLFFLQSLSYDKLAIGANPVRNLPAALLPFVHSHFTDLYNRLDRLTLPASKRACLAK